MPWKYNPFTDSLDQTGSGGGTSYIDGDVEYHSNLPVTVGSPAVNSAFLVRKGEGLYFLTRKPAGIWVRELNNGNLNDWKYAGTFSDLYRDANFRIINDADVSKELAFSLSSIATGTTRTITVPNANVTLPNQGTSTTDSPEFAGLSVVNTGGDGVQLLVTNDDGVISSIAPLSSEQKSEARTSLGLGPAALGDFAAPPAIGNTTPAAISGTTGTFTTLTANNGTLTASAPVLNVQQTWNGAGVNFVAAEINVTRTASSNDAELLRLSENGSPVLYFRRTGQIVAGTITLTSTGGSTLVSGTGSNFVLGSLALGVYLNNDSTNHTLAIRNSTNAQTFRLYTTIGGTGNADFERLFIRGQTGGSFLIGTEKGGTGTARALELQTDGTTRMAISTTGLVNVSATGNAAVTVTSTTGASDGAYFSAIGQKESFFNVYANGNASGSRIMRFGNTNSGTFIVQALNDSATAVLRTPLSISNIAPTGSFSIAGNGSIGIGGGATTKLAVAGGLAVQGLGDVPSSGFGVEISNTADLSYIGAYNRSSLLYRDILLFGKDVIFESGGTQRMRILSTGNVGIGTAAPTEKLTVFNDTKCVITSQFASNQCLAFGGDTTVGPYLVSHTDGNGNSFGNFIGVRQRFGASGFIIDTSPATAVGIARSWTERLIVEPANGNVGIGTVSPTAKLHVVGTVLFDGAFTVADARNIAVGTTTGTKIGTSTSQKIGFFNATPVVQQAAVADATDAASTQARLNDLLARLRTLGLIAT
jgi:hypothetical protein